MPVDMRAAAARAGVPVVRAGWRRTAAFVAGLGVLALGAGIAAPAQAAGRVAERPTATTVGTAGTCELREGIQLRDAIGNVFTKAVYCDNIPSDVYARADFASPVSGWLKLSPSWFPCFTTGPEDTKGNKTWYYTQGDQVGAMPRIKGWGVVPAEVVQLPTGTPHPFPDLPRCPWF
ncbi:hypothetical protein GCM10012286_36380 [Streptomyces lasiicapitis]|uniref:Secreted protein n=1 Tax=Streptomyces lasiicapitis TaxID=1923961 RepID=A0ABQ2M2M2_9ACTN|nr:hypothetical protein GCM10012286_36380 [Streptomyces lasiicapitis]